ncbi:MAG: APC family permease [Acidimicrobiales bacterium]|jgi:amino acid transporter
MPTEVAMGGGSKYEVPGPFGAPVPSDESVATLRADTLNLFDSTVVAVSSVAPAYTLAATMAVLFLTGGVGYAGPAVIWISFVPVLFIAISYFHLNRRDPDCGASYAWLSKLVHPTVGWFNGWVQVATSIVFCISAPIVAGSYTLQLFNEWGWVSSATAADIGTQAVCAGAWLALITFICIWGIRWTTNFQWLLLIVEYTAVIVFSVWGIVKVAATHPKGSTGFHWAWMSPMSIHGFAALSAGIVLGVFFFWGWDTATNLNEESKNATKTPGHAGIIAMFLLLLVFAINIIAAQMLLPEKAWNAHSLTILLYFAQQAAGHWAGYVMIIAVLSSTVATTQTTLLPAARITLSMSRDGVFPRLFGTIQGKLKTPAVGTLILAFICMFGIVLVSNVSSINNVFSNLILNIGVLIAFYYGVTGVTCAWAYRKVAFQKTSFFFTGILLPFIGGVVLLLVGIKVIAVAGWSGAYPDIIALLLGLPLVVVARLTTTGDFFKQQPIAYTEIGE